MIEKKRKEHRMPHILQHETSHDCVNNRNTSWNITYILYMNKPNIKVIKRKNVIDENKEGENHMDTMQTT